MKTEKERQNLLTGEGGGRGAESNDRREGRSSYLHIVVPCSLPDTGLFFIQPDNNICSIEKLYKIHKGNGDVVIRQSNMKQL